MSYTEEVIDSAARGSNGPLLNPRAIAFLQEARKWANFLAIIGFVGLGLMVVAALFMGTIMASITPMAGMGVSGGFMASFIYIVIALIYFFPILYLYRFASKLKLALNAHDDIALESAFENLKSHYKFIGVLAIIMMAFYFLSFFFMLAAGLGAAQFF